MATIARLKIWVTGDVLTAADLNGEFNVVLNGVNNINEENIGTIKYLNMNNDSATDTLKIKSSVSTVGLLIYS